LGDHYRNSEIYEKLFIGPMVCFKNLKQQNQPKRNKTTVLTSFIIKDVNWISQVKSGTVSSSYTLHTLGNSKHVVKYIYLQ